MLLCVPSDHVSYIVVDHFDDVADVVVFSICYLCYFLIFSSLNQCRATATPIRIDPLHPQSTTRLLSTPSITTPIIPPLHLYFSFNAACIQRPYLFHSLRSWLESEKTLTLIPITSQSEKMLTIPARRTHCLPDQSLFAEETEKIVQRCATCFPLAWAAFVLLFFSARQCGQDLISCSVALVFFRPLCG